MVTKTIDYDIEIQDIEHGKYTILLVINFCEGITDWLSFGLLQSSLDNLHACLQNNTPWIACDESLKIYRDCRGLIFHCKTEYLPDIPILLEKDKAEWLISEIGRRATK